MTDKNENGNPAPMPGTVSQDTIEKEYLDGGGATCPFCHSRDIEGGPYDGDGTEIYMSVECNRCHATWADKYTLSGMICEYDGEGSR